MAPRERSPRPSARLLLRRGWADPGLYIAFGGIAWLAYVSADAERNAMLEASIGYTGSRLALITLLAALVWGTVQGFRKRMVVYIDDEATPGYSDAAVTLLLMAGVPMVLFALGLLAYLVTDLLAPRGFEPPRYERAGLALLGVIWGVGFVGMYARLYAYNRGAISALAAFVTKIAWCALAVLFLFQAGSAIGTRPRGAGSEAAPGFVSSVILAAAAVFVIGRLTYDGPSLREK